MKKFVKNILGLALFCGAMAILFSGCYEETYYHHHHHYSPEYYRRHHIPPPAGVDFNVDVR